MSQQIVEQVKIALITRGQRWKTNEDAFQITGRVAWILRAQGAMLVGKNPGQNGADTPVGRVSHDAIAFPGGWKDVLAGAGPEDNFNLPCWEPTGSSGAQLIAPYDLDLGATPDVPAPVEPAPVPPVVVPAPPVDAQAATMAEILRKLDLLLEMPAPVYDVPYNVTAPWPIGHLQGTFVMTPRKR